MIDAIIVESDKNALITLETLLSENCQQAQVCVKITNLDDFSDLIDLYKPDLVFLELQNSQNIYLEILNLRYPLNFEIIVISNTEKYAINAVNCCASGYLLKPIKNDELINSVRNASQRIIEKKGRILNNFTTNNLINGNPLEEVIGIPTIEGYEFVPVKNICSVKSKSKK